MICPRCGYDMENKSKCLRCGFEVKTLAVVDDSSENNSEDTREDKIEIKVIDPCNVYLTHPYGVEDDEMDSVFGGGPFGSIFDMLFGDPISDLLGGLFGVNTSSRRSSHTSPQDEAPKKKRKQGPIVDVAADEVELYDSDGNPVKPKKSTSTQEKTTEHTGAQKSEQTTKNTFKRGNGKK